MTTLTAKTAAAVLNRFDARLMAATSNPLPLTESTRSQLAYLRKAAGTDAEPAPCTRYVELVVGSSNGRDVELILRCEMNRESGYDVGVELSWSGSGAHSLTYAEEFAAVVRTATELAREFEALVAVETAPEVEPLGRCNACGAELTVQGVCEHCPPDADGVEVSRTDVEDRCPACGGFVERGDGTEDEPPEPYCTACGASISAETGRVVRV
jgi:hypothetical protein